MAQDRRNVPFANDRWPGALLLAAWVLRYVGRYGLHLHRPPKWAGWFDQERYILSAQALARGDLSPEAHWYALAYPLTGAASIWLAKGLPYLLTDALLYALAGLGFIRAMRPLGIGPPVALIVFLLTTIGAVSPLWLIPWSTTLSAALIWWLLALVIETLALDDEPGALSRRRLLAIGALAGALPLTRVTDGLIGAIALAFLVVALWRQGRLTAAAIAWLAVGAIAPGLLYLPLHLAIYGPRASAYAVAAANTGFVFADLPWRSYVLLVTAQPWYPDSRSLIEALPWLLPGAAGLSVAAWTGDAAARRALALIAAVALPSTLLTLAYVDLHPPGLWLFNNAHYFKWLFPLFGAGVWLWLKCFRSRRGALTAIGALLLWLAPACIRVIPRAVGEEEPARMLLFRGDTARPWLDGYFATARITDSRGRLENIGQFHQLPDAGGQRALAITRLFAAHPRRDDPGEAAAFRRSEPPYARYAVRLSLGLPCWVDRPACTVPRR